MALAALLATASGRSVLEAAGCFLDERAFVAALRPPAEPGLVQHLRLPEGACPVVMHQQPCPDPRRSVLAKITAVTRLPAPAAPVAVWIDTDRAESDRQATRLRWPSPSGWHRIKLTPPHTKHQESRLIMLDRGQLAAAADRLGAYLHQLPEGRPLALAQAARLRPHLVPSGPVTLAGLNTGLTRFLLAETLAIRPSAVLVSGLAASGLLTGALEMALAALPDLIRVVNARVAALCRLGIDPAVRPLPDDYLPLFVSSPSDGSRLRLRLERQGGTRLAVALGRDGTRHRFHLGTGRWDLDELLATGRWSPDVILPLLLEPSISGLLVGESSARYCLVLAAVARQVLGREPVPRLVPAELTHPPAIGMAPDSLLHRYLTSSACQNGRGALSRAASGARPGTS